MTITVLHFINSSLIIFTVSRTINPAIIALVVAIAGIMFPAIALSSKNLTMIIL